MTSSLASRLTSTLDFQAAALTLRAERQRVLAGNVANADTPGYQAREMDFAAALRNATGLSSAGSGALPMAMPGQASLTAAAAWQGSLQARGVDAGPAAAARLAASSLGMSTTHAAHLSGGGSASGFSDGTPLIYARNAQDAVDRNTVDMDRERASLADNTVRYDAALRFLNGQIKTLQDAMRSPQQG